MNVLLCYSDRLCLFPGVSSVEWPQVWNDLKLQYGGLAYCITSEVAVVVNKKILGGEKELKELVESKYNYHICPDYYKEAIGEFTKYVDNTGVCIFK